MIDLKWSSAEKKVARRAFDTAVARECATLLADFKRRAAQVENLDDIWAIHRYLTQQRRELDAKYDYRYSQLIVVFARLLREKWLEDKDLEGLRADKLEAIHRVLGL